MDLHFASVWEAVTDATPDALAIVAGDVRLTYREWDDRSARLASALAAAGVGEGSKVALYLYNEPEYLIAQYATFKLRAVPVNVNYRYRDTELVALVANSDSEVLVYNTSLGDRVAAARERMTGVRLLIKVDDGDPPGGEPDRRGGADHPDDALPFEQLVAEHPPQPRVDRLGGDLYMLYTGGTTGLPKGVMYRHDAFVAACYANLLTEANAPPPPGRVEDLAGVLRWFGTDRRMVSLPCPPLMHGTGMWVGAMRALLTGGTVALLRSRTFDPDEVWRLVEREAVTHVVIVGDAFARPLLRALQQAEAGGHAYGASSVTDMISSGAMWSAEIKDGLTARLDARLTDALGSTEGTGYGASVVARGAHVATAHFALAPGTRVLSEDDTDVVPGSGALGLLATPTPAYGYYKDPARSARTFRRIEGASYVMTGDWATVLDDGTVNLLGRGSNCINSGGEKIFPEEVEEALKRHGAVDDCLVVGLPDERFGEQVVAVAGSPAAPPPTGDELRAFLRNELAGYKIPQRVVVVDEVRRAPNGKADYGWARQEAASATSGRGRRAEAVARPKR